MVAYIAVHGGAGFHDFNLDASVKRSLKEYALLTLCVAIHVIYHVASNRSCKNAIQLAQRPSSTPLTTVQEAISVLEDHPSFNAGSCFDH
jgi:isoaspartyl peptidase/L-asparaginase-like protein (Ntn-hydrolase superfamily)